MISHAYSSPSISFFLLLVFGLVLSGCDSVVDSEPDMLPLTAPAIAHDLEEGKMLNVESNVTVEFVKLLSDTRCPLEDICEDNGRVEASFIMDMDGKRAPFSLSGFVGPEGEQQVRFDVGPYEVILQQLDPYPMEEIWICHPLQSCVFKDRTSVLNDG